MKPIKDIKQKAIHELKEGKWEEIASSYLNNPSSIKGLLSKILQFLKDKTYTPILKDAVVLYFYVEDIVKGNYKGYNYKKLLTILAILIYLISPYDLIPDFLVSIGFLDDAALIGFAVNSFEKELHKYLRWRKKQRQ